MTNNYKHTDSYIRMWFVIRIRRFLSPLRFVRNDILSIACARSRLRSNWHHTANTQIRKFVCDLLSVQRKHRFVVTLSSACTEPDEVSKDASVRYL